MLLSILFISCTLKESVEAFEFRNLTIQFNEDINHYNIESTFLH